MTEHKFSIAIDGPAGAGKSTIAKKIAARLHFIYVDTGAMYRAMALSMLRQNIDRDNVASVARACAQMEISISYQNNVQQVLLNGENVSGLIREEEVGKMASAISGYQPVRDKLLDLQQGLARISDVVMDGRDIGTCVLPDADVKIYLTASSQVRAGRRYKELTEKEIMCNLEEIEQDIIERDHRDMSREIAPLKQAKDAQLLDASDLTVSEVVERIIQIAADRGIKVSE